jgi:hypothetical protein
VSNQLRMDDLFRLLSDRKHIPKSRILLKIPPEKQFVHAWRGLAGGQAVNFLFSPAAG